MEHTSGDINMSKYKLTYKTKTDLVVELKQLLVVKLNKDILLSLLTQRQKETKRKIK